MVEAEKKDNGLSFITPSHVGNLWYFVVRRSAKKVYEDFQDLFSWLLKRNKDIAVHYCVLLKEKNR